MNCAQRCAEVELRSMNVDVAKSKKFLGGEHELTKWFVRVFALASDDASFPFPKHWKVGEENNCTLLRVTIRPVLCVTDIRREITDSIGYFASRIARDMTRESTVQPWSFVRKDGTVSFVVFPKPFATALGG